MFTYDNDGTIKIKDEFLEFSNIIEEEYISPALKKLETLFSMQLGNREDIIFVVWTETAHDLIKSSHCSCEHGYFNDCFLSKSREEKISFFLNNHPLSFHRFQEVVRSKL